MPDCPGSGQPLVTHRCSHCGHRFNTWILIDAPEHADERGIIRSDPVKVRQALAVVRANEQQLGDATAPPRRHGGGEYGGSTKGLA